MESMPYVKQARQINDEMIADSHAALILAAADHATSELEYFIRGYLYLSTPGISTDDEIWDYLVGTRLVLELARHTMSLRKGNTLRRALFDGPQNC